MINRHPIENPNKQTNKQKKRKEKRKKSRANLEVESSVGQHQLAQIKLKLLQSARKLPSTEHKASGDLIPGDMIHNLLLHNRLHKDLVFPPPLHTTKITNTNFNTHTTNNT